MIYFVLFLVVTVAFGVARFVVPVSGIDGGDIYKDMAHIWVGVLFGTAGALTYANYLPLVDYTRLESLVIASSMAARWWTMAVGLTVAEVVAFFVRG